MKIAKFQRAQYMFIDGAYLFDAGWLFFAVWSLILLTIFVIAFGDDLMYAAHGDTGSTVKKTQSTMRSATSHTH
jgi:hypothetical protein